MRYAVILDGLVVNTIVWDGSDYDPGSEYTVIDCPDEVGIGWGWNSTDSFTAPSEDPA